MNDDAGRYYLDAEDGFVIEDYNHRTPLSNFLPGIAGPWGIPLGSGFCNY